jgi:hypothetical protein
MPHTSESMYGAPGTPWENKAMSKSNWLVMVLASALVILVFGWVHRDKTVQSKVYWQKVRSPEVLPNWILCGGTLIGIVVAIGTLKTIASQTDATSKAAIAAKDAVAVSMNAERAWILDNAAPIPLLPAPGIEVKTSISLTNHGRVPALVTDLKIRFHLVDPHADPYISQHPEYDSEPFQFLELGTSGLVLAPQQSIDFSQIIEGIHLTATQRQLLYNDPSHLALFLYGLVTYNDGFEKGRITQFCYTWKGSEFRRIGPPGYVNAT